MLVVVGGHSRNIGKTSVMCSIIDSTRQFAWTAIKITQYGHGVCSKDGEACECALPDHPFALQQELNASAGTDTSRFLAASTPELLGTYRVRQSWRGDPRFATPLGIAGEHHHRVQ